MPKSKTRKYGHVENSLLDPDAVWPSDCSQALTFAAEKGFTGPSSMYTERSTPLNTDLSICNFLQDVKKIGEGKYGKVYLGEFNGAKIAIKQYRDDAYFDDYQDIDIATKLRHPMLCRSTQILLCDHYPIRSGVILIVMEAFETNLMDVIWEDLSVDTKLASESLIQGLHFLHKNNILHLDVKPDNVLVNMSTEPKRVVLSDFGLCRYGNRFVHTGKHMVGTEPFIKPSCFENPHIYNFESDIWALGMTLAGLILKRDTNKEATSLSVKTSHGENECKIQNQNYSEFIIGELEGTEHHDMIKNMFAGNMPPQTAPFDSPGTVLIESAENIDPRHESECRDCYEMAKLLKYKDSHRSLTIHLIYLTYKFGIEDYNIVDRLEVCGNIAGETMNMPVEPMKKRKYISLRNKIITKTNGSMTTCFLVDNHILDKIMSNPLTYFAKLHETIMSAYKNE